MIDLLCDNDSHQTSGNWNNHVYRILESCAKCWELKLNFPGSEKYLENWDLTERCLEFFSVLLCEYTNFVTRVVRIELIVVSVWQVPMIFPTCMRWLWTWCQSGDLIQLPRTNENFILNVLNKVNGAGMFWKMFLNSSYGYCSNSILS